MLGLPTSFECSWASCPTMPVFQFLPTLVGQKREWYVSLKTIRALNTILFSSLPNPSGFASSTGTRQISTHFGKNSVWREGAIESNRTNWWPLEQSLKTTDWMVFPIRYPKFTAQERVPCRADVTQYHVRSTPRSVLILLKKCRQIKQLIVANNSFFL